MMFEKIKKYKIKITFNSDDMKVHNVSTNDFLLNKPISQKVLQLLISQAEKEIGFYADDSKLLVEAVSTNNDIIFTITKIKESHSSSNKYFYKFSCFDDFNDFCTYVKNQYFELIPCIELFFYNNTFYLYSTSELSHSFIIALSEFAESIPYSYKFDGALHEYGKIVFSNNMKKIQ